jgi:hypothetical protein
MTLCTADQYAVEVPKIINTVQTYMLALRCYNNLSQSFKFTTEVQHKRTSISLRILWHVRYNIMRYLFIQLDVQRKLGLG